MQRCLYESVFFDPHLLHKILLCNVHGELPEAVAKMHEKRRERMLRDFFAAPFSLLTVKGGVWRYDFMRAGVIESIDLMLE